MDADDGILLFARSAARIVAPEVSLSHAGGRKAGHVRGAAGAPLHVLLGPPGHVPSATYAALAVDPSALLAASAIPSHRALAGGGLAAPVPAAPAVSGDECVVVRLRKRRRVRVSTRSQRAARSRSRR